MTYPIYLGGPALRWHTNIQAISLFIFLLLFFVFMGPSMGRPVIQSENPTVPDYFGPYGAFVESVCQELSEKPDKVAQVEECYVGCRLPNRIVPSTARNLSFRSKDCTRITQTHRKDGSSKISQYFSLSHTALERQFFAHCPQNTLQVIVDECTDF